MAEIKRFNFSARNPSGESIAGNEEGEDADAVVNRLQARGLLVTSIKEDAGAQGQQILNRPSKKFAKTRKFNHFAIKEDDLIVFSRQLATALGSGVPLLKGLNIITSQVGSKKLFDVCAGITQDVESGLSLRDALSKHSKVFSSLWINLVETGEASGNLPIVLEKLAYYLEKRAAFKSKIVSAMVYPIILMTVAIGAIAVFLIAIVPKFAEIFQGLNVTLPPATKLLIALSQNTRQSFPLILLLLVGSIIALTQYIKTRSGKRIFDNFVLKVPLFSEFFRLSEIEKFCSNIATLLESGVPILYALEIAERSSTNTVVQDILRDVKTNVREGKPMLVPMEESGFFPPMVTQMVGMGEEIGELDKMFKKVATLYSETLETQITRFTAMFEPLMIVFMGGIIGTMVIAMFLPIFKLAQVGR